MIKYIKFNREWKGIFDVIIINKITVTRVILVLLIICTVSFIWSNSLETAEESSEMSNTVVEKVKPIVDPKDRIADNIFIMIVRKAAHFAEFALLGSEIYLFLATFNGIKKNTFVSFITPILLSFIIAVTDECLQLTSTGRSCQFSDMMIDLAGIATGVVFITIIAAIIKRVHTKAK